MQSLDYKRKFYRKNLENSWIISVYCEGGLFMFMYMYKYKLVVKHILTPLNYLSRFQFLETTFPFLLPRWKRFTDST